MVYHSGAKAWKVIGEDGDRGELLLEYMWQSGVTAEVPVAQVRKQNIGHLIEEAGDFRELFSVLEKCEYVEWDHRDERHVAHAYDLECVMGLIVRRGGAEARGALQEIPETYGLRKRVIELAISVLGERPGSPVLGNHLVLLPDRPREIPAGLRDLAESDEIEFAASR